MQSHQPLVPAKKKSSGLAIGLAIGCGGALLLCIPLALVAVAGVRQYIANAKTAEARNTVVMIGKLAASAYEQDKRLCPSATKPVPADSQMISGKKYQSTLEEWNIDKTKNAGFGCLKFEMSYPQYFQYDYQSSPTGFVVTAKGDLNGDGVLSKFTYRGIIEDGAVRVSPNIEESNPTE
jgi:type IV pilus assembly protein PilA